MVLPEGIKVRGDGHRGSDLGGGGRAAQRIAMHGKWTGLVPRLCRGWVVVRVGAKYRRGHDAFGGVAADRGECMGGVSATE